MSQQILKSLAADQLPTALLLQGKRNNLQQSSSFKGDSRSPYSDVFRWSECFRRTGNIIHIQTRATERSPIGARTVYRLCSKHEGSFQYTYRFPKRCTTGYGNFHASTAIRFSVTSGTGSSKKNLNEHLLLMNCI